MRCLIDGDVLAYKAAFATEYNTYVNPETNLIFRYKKSLDDYYQNNLDEDDPEFISYESDYEKIKVTEPESHTRMAIDVIIDSILRNTDCLEYIIYISGGGKTFRHEVDYPVSYKGGRPDKPSNFDVAKQYILEYKNSESVVGIEVDDALGIEQTRSNGNTIIASIDKDLLQIPGLHYNIDKQLIISIDDFQGYKNFCVQMLMGDRVDNIIGIRGIGFKKATDLLKNCITKNELDEVVIGQYCKAWPNQWEYFLEANRKLLWILREPIK